MIFQIKYYLFFNLGDSKLIKLSPLQLILYYKKNHISSFYYFGDILINHHFYFIIFQNT